LYKVAHFSSEEKATLLAFMQQYNFAQITGMGNDYPVATQIPLLLDVQADGSIYLLGHIMRKSEHHIAFEQHPKVLVSFTGPHAYISANLYNIQQSAGTWNYMTVHAQGIVHLLDEAGTQDAIHQLTAHYENAESPAAFEKISPVYIQPLLKAIVGIRIAVTQLDHVFKLSQNKPADTQARIIEALRLQQDTTAEILAQEMERRLKK
jgi:transcriptional regulator